jgi:virginiamycin B lyase
MAVPQADGKTAAIEAGAQVHHAEHSHQRLDRVDSATNTISAQISSEVADSEGAIATGAGAVWMMTDKNGTLSKIDPATNRVVKNIQIDSGSFAVAAGPEAVWITSTVHNILVRVAPQTNRIITRLPTGPSPRFLCVTDDSVWVLNQGDGTVTRVDVRSNQVIATIKVGNSGPGGDIAAGEGAVWVTAVNVPLTRIDPARNKVTSQFVGPGGDALRVGHGSLWMCSFFLQEMWRVAPPG